MYDRNIKIEDPPKTVPPPEGAKFKPWIELGLDECHFHLDGFWDGPNNTFPCCGLPVKGGRQLGQRFCEYHYQVAISKEELNDS